MPSTPTFLEPNSRSTPTTPIPSPQLPQNPTPFTDTPHFTHTPYLTITSPNSNPPHSPSPEPSSPDILSNESDDDYGIPLERPLSRPMVNFREDMEHEEDYEIGWEWIEEDTGPYIAPYTGFQQCLLDPTKNNPEDFFEALFTSHMYTIMAEETNKYAQRKIQRGKYFQ